MRIKEYRTELDKDKKNVLCEIGYYDVTEDIFDKPEKIARFYEGDRIIVDGTHNKVSAFALDGKAVSLSPILAGDKTIIPLDELTHSVYIIKINNKNIFILIYKIWLIIYYFNFIKKVF